MSLKALQVVGYKNAGKTTLVCEIVRRLTTAGLRVGTIKHDAHDADPEPAGADTRLHRTAGAHFTAMTSDARTMWVQERPTTMDDLLSAMEEAGVEAVIAEGFKSARFPKLVLLRGEQDADLLQLPGIIAVVARTPAFPADTAIYPVFRTDHFRFDPLLAFIEEWLLSG